MGGTLSCHRYRVDYAHLIYIPDCAYFGKEIRLGKGKGKGNGAWSLAESSVLEDG